MAVRSGSVCRSLGSSRGGRQRADLPPVSKVSFLRSHTLTHSPRAPFPPPVPSSWLAETPRSTRIVGPRIRQGADESGWRNEHYQVFYPLGSSSPHATQAVASTSAEGIRETAMCSGISLEKGQSGTRSNTAFTIERAAGALFGLPTYGVHMTAYEGQEDGMRVWVPRRAMSKSTFPGYLDNVSDQRAVVHGQFVTADPGGWRAGACYP